MLFLQVLIYKIAKGATDFCAWHLLYILADLYICIYILTRLRVKRIHAT